MGSHFSNALPINDNTSFYCEKLCACVCVFLNKVTTYFCFFLKGKKTKIRYKTLKCFIFKRKTGLQKLSLSLGYLKESLLNKWMKSWQSINHKYREKSRKQVHTII